MADIFVTDFKFAERYGNHRTWPWRCAKRDPGFPQPIRLSPGCTRWKLSDIEAWEHRKSSEQ